MPVCPEKVRAASGEWGAKRRKGGAAGVGNIFCFTMQIAMTVGFLTRYPANWSLVKKGIREAMYLQICRTYAHVSEIYSYGAPLASKCKGSSCC